MRKAIISSKEMLITLYEKEGLTTFQISQKMGCCQATIWKKLKEYGIKARLPGVKRVKLSRKELEDLYINKRLSTWKIEKMTKIPRGTIHRKLKEYKIKTRDLATSNIIYPRKDFSGDLIEKAYLIGFRLGDLGVRKQYSNSKTICVASGSTITEQIDLIRSLFEGYGNLWIKKSRGNKINLQVFLNESFDFLLGKKFPEWISKDKDYFFSFLGGFSDAEGSIKIYNEQARYSLGNYDNILLKIIRANLIHYGIPCKNIITDCRKGKNNNQGYVYKSNYSSLRIYNSKDLLKLLLELKKYIKHKNRIKDLNIALDNLNNRRIR